MMGNCVVVRSLFTGCCMQFLFRFLRNLFSIFSPELQFIKKYFLSVVAMFTLPGSSIAVHPTSGAEDLE